MSAQKHASAKEDVKPELSDSFKEIVDLILLDDSEQLKEILQEKTHLLNQTVEIGEDRHVFDLIKLAIFYGKSNSIRAIIEAGYDVNKKNTDTGRTPLHEAAYRGDADIFKLLVEAGADPSMLGGVSKDGKLIEEYNIAHFAAISRNFELFKYIEENFGKSSQRPDGIDILSLTPVNNQSVCHLIFFDEKNDNDISEMLEHMIDKGYDYNSSQINGFKPLIMAMGANDIRCTRILVEKGADIYETFGYSLPSGQNVEDSALSIAMGKKSARIQLGGDVFAEIFVKINPTQVIKDIILEKFKKDMDVIKQQEQTAKEGELFPCSSSRDISESNPKPSGGFYSSVISEKEKQQQEFNQKFLKGIEGKGLDSPTRVVGKKGEELNLQQAIEKIYKIYKDKEGNPRLKPVADAFREAFGSNEKGNLTFDKLDESVNVAAASGEDKPDSKEDKPKAQGYNVKDVESTFSLARSAIGVLARNKKFTQSMKIQLERDIGHLQTQLGLDRQIGR
ncbi:ankyrin repeat domain-containing protein [Rickettsiales bacterium]|nr:ankyrin repeat domain-containing protein [Rickettsiales bacterium]